MKWTPQTVKPVKMIDPIRVAFAALLMIAKLTSRPGIQNYGIPPKKGEVNVRRRLDV